MALPTYIGKTNMAAAVSATSLNIDWSTSGRIADDFLIAVVESESTSVTMSGWTEISSSPQLNGPVDTVGSTKLSVFYKVSTGSEGNTAVSKAGSNHLCVMGFVFRGVNVSTPINVTVGETSGGSTAVSLPAVTTTAPKCLVVHLVGNDRDAASTSNFSSPTNANLANITIRHDQTVTSGNGGGIACVTADYMPAGNTGATSITNAVAGNLAKITLALTPTVIDTPEGVVNLTFAPLTANIVGIEPTLGSGSISFAPMTIVGTGALVLTGQSNFTFRALTTGSTGNLNIAGNSGFTFAAMTVGATGIVTNAGIANFTFKPLTTASTGNLSLAATSSISFNAMTVSATGVTVLLGVVDFTFRPLTIVSTGREIVAIVASDLRKVSANFENRIAIANIENRIARASNA